MPDKVWTAFHDYGLGRIIRELWWSKRTGLLKCDSGGSARTLYFEAGLVRFAVSSDEGEQISRVLVNRGFLTQDQIDSVRANFRQDRSIGRNLVDMGLITGQEFTKAVHAQVFQIFCGCLHRNEGHYLFSPENMPAKLPKIPLPFPDAILQSLLKTRDKVWISDQFPADLNFIVEINMERPINFHEVDIGDFALNIYRLINGRRDFRRLAFEAGVDDFLLLKFLFGLKLLDYIQIRERATEPDEPPLPEEEELKWAEDTLSDAVVPQRDSADRVTQDRVAPDRVAQDRVAQDRVMHDRASPDFEEDAEIDSDDQPFERVLEERLSLGTAKPRVIPPIIEKTAKPAAEKTFTEVTADEPSVLLDVDDAPPDIGDSTDVFGHLIAEESRFQVRKSQETPGPTPKPKPKREKKSSEWEDEEIDSSFDRIMEEKPSSDTSEKNPVATPPPELPKDWRDLDEEDTAPDFFDDDLAEIPAAAVDDPDWNDVTGRKDSEEWGTAKFQIRENSRPDTGIADELQNVARLALDDEPEQPMETVSQPPPEIIMPDLAPEEDPPEPPPEQAPANRARWLGWTAAAGLALALLIAGYLYRNSITSWFGSFSQGGDTPHQAQPGALPPTVPENPEETVSTSPPPADTEKETPPVESISNSDTTIQPDFPENGAAPEETLPMGATSTSNRPPEVRFQEMAQSWRNSMAAHGDQFTLGIYMVCDIRNVEKAHQNAAGAEAFFILPRTYRDKSCYWICWGLYPNRSEAIAGTATLPAGLIEAGTKIKAYRLRQLLD